jgi:HEAT repeat protein
MMRNTLFLIISFLAASNCLVYPSHARQVTKNLTNSGVSLKDDFAVLASKGFVKSPKEAYPIQLGAFRLKLNAEALYNEVKSNPGVDAKIIEEDGYYKVRIDRHYESHMMMKSSDSTGNKNSIPSVTPGIFEPTTFLPYTVEATEKAATEIRNFFLIKEDSPWLKKINYFGKSLVFINTLIAAIVFSISTMIILLVIILLNRRRMEKEESLHQYLLEKYQSLILDYLFGNANPDEFRLIASDTYRRQVLIDQMIDVSTNLKGDEGKKLLSLYKHLGLDRDSIARAYDRRWHKKIKGFRELAFMNIKEANDAMYKALNSSNEILRMEAQIALVRLNDDDPFQFLSHLTTPFSLWEQITLHDLIIQHNIPLPSFQKWLTSANPTVIMFALRMIREFKQKESEDRVRQTLMHPDPSVRQLAVQVAGDLDMRSTLETMKSMYKNQEYNICLEIIKSMGKMPDISMMGFLKLVIDKEDDVQLQIEATKAIENNGEKGVKELVKLMESEYKNYNIIIRHVLDHRIF